MRASEFDGIVIGGGHNGLITASYLARAGLKIAVVEARASVGGAFATDEVTAPGFKHQLHAHYCKIHESPVHSDLELDRYGVSYVFPDPKMAIVKKNGYFLYHQEKQKNYESIRRISENDAKRAINGAVAQDPAIPPETWSVPNYPD